MRLPLFPLHTVLFPGSTLPLHVFELRYRRMLADIAAEPRFGVVAIRAGTEVGATSETHRIGTVASVERLAELADGRFELLVRGGERFEIVTRHPDDPYPVAEARPLDEPQGDDVDRSLAAAGAAFTRYASVVRSLGAEIGVPPAGEPVATSYRLSALLHVDVPVKQRLLACSSAAERLRLAAAIARREARLLATIGPSAGVPLGRPSPN